MDYISELPDPILHRILCLLPQTQAIQTSVLSKSWRHLGSTRPKLEFREAESRFAATHRTEFLHILYNTLQRYNRQNLPVKEVILEVSYSVNNSSLFRRLGKLIPMVLADKTVDKFHLTVPIYDVSSGVVFQAEFLTELHLNGIHIRGSAADREPFPIKSLKTLSLHQVNIQKSTLENVIRSCPLIERIIIFRCVGPSNDSLLIPSLIFQAKFLTELNLCSCKLKSIRHTLFLTNRLKTLSLVQVHTQKATLENLIQSCPLIERITCTGSSYHSLVIPSLIFQAKFLTELNLRWCKLYSNPHTLFMINRLKTLSLELVDIADEDLEKIIRSSPSIECIRVSDHRLINTIKIDNDNYRRFLHLKSLHLHGVKLPAESFYSISYNFSALQDLELKRCNGFKDIQLTLGSVKRLVIIIDPDHIIDEATIYAPNVRHFEFSVHTPPKLTFYTEDACREWKSHVVVVPSKVISDERVLPWVLKLSRLLNALSESQISLEVSVVPLMNLTVKGTNDVGFCKPVAVEHVHLTGAEHCQKPPLFHAFLNCLFLLCRPRCISISWYARSYHSKNKLAEYIIHKLIRKQGEMSSGYFWEPHLERVSMEVWDNDFKEWIEPVEGTSFLKSSPSDLQIRFQIKWND